MATLLLLDGLSCGNQQQAGAYSFLSSLHRLDHCNPSPSHGCDRPCEPLSSTLRCSSSNDLLDRLDPPLPRFPSNGSNNHRGVSGPRLVLEMRPTLSQPYRDEPLDTLMQPSPPGNADTSSHIRIIADGQEVDTKRNQRVSPSYLSMSQSRRATVLHAAVAPLQMKDLKGRTGFYMGFAAIVLGFMAVLQKGGLFGNNTITTICTSCDGYGRRVCKLCKGNGSIVWEGKLKRTDICPSCLGARIKKCSDCGGHRMRSDEPPFLQQLAESRASRT